MLASACPALHALITILPASAGLPIETNKPRELGIRKGCHRKKNEGADQVNACNVHEVQTLVYRGKTIPSAVFADVQADVRGLLNEHLDGVSESKSWDADSLRTGEKKSGRPPMPFAVSARQRDWCLDRGVVLSAGAVDFARWRGARRANTRRIQPTSNEASVRKTKPDGSSTPRSRH